MNLQRARQDLLSEKSERVRKGQEPVNGMRAREKHRARKIFLNCQFDGIFGTFNVEIHFWNMKLKIEIKGFPFLLISIKNSYRKGASLSSLLVLGRLNLQTAFQLLKIEFRRNCKSWKILAHSQIKYRSKYEKERSMIQGKVPNITSSRNMLFKQKLWGHLECWFMYS